MRLSKNEQFIFDELISYVTPINVVNNMHFKTMRYNVKINRAGETTRWLCAYYEKKKKKKRKRALLLKNCRACSGRNSTRGIMHREAACVAEFRKNTSLYYFSPRLTRDAECSHAQISVFPFQH